MTTAPQKQTYQNFSVVSPPQSAGTAVLWVRFHTAGKPVNVLTESFLREFDQFVASTEAKEADVLVFMADKPGIFLAGADLSLIEAIATPDEAYQRAQDGKAMFHRLCQLKAKRLAWLNGTCLGGGYEFALFCDAIALENVSSYSVGLPETKLGVLPGFGGTVQLPLRIGPSAALDIILQGKAVDPKTAKRLGMVDVVVPAGTLPTEDVCRQVFAKRRSSRLRSWLWRGMTPLVVAMARRSIRKTALHYPALSGVCDVVAASVWMSRASALKKESVAFGKVAATPTCKNLIRIFHLSESSKKLGKTAPRRLTSLGVVGGGVMGMGIAIGCAKSGVFTRCRDMKSEVMTKSLQATRAMSKKVWGKWTNLLGRNLRLQTDAYGFSSLDLAIEAVFEDISVKHQVFRELEQTVSRNCILVTNTSSLPLQEIGTVVQHKDRFAGLHFFNPVLRMPLVEVIRGAETSEDVIAVLCGLVVQMGKFPLVCQDTSGFVVNRVLGFYLNEGIHLLGDGVDPERIERVAQAFGMPMGPLRLLDEIGLDIGYHVLQTLNAKHKGRYVPRPGMEKMLTDKRLGQKSGIGFYRFSDRKKPELDVAYSKSLCVPVDTKGEITEADIRDRLILPMIAEGCRVVQEGVVTGAEWVDVGMVFGAGFPPYRGGLMAYGKSLGVDRIKGRLSQFAGRYAYPERFTFLQEQDILVSLSSRIESGTSSRKEAIRDPQ